MATVVMLTSLVLPVSVFADPSPTPDITRMVAPRGFPRTNEARGPYPALDPSSSVADDCARARKAGKTCVLDVPAEDVAGRTPTIGDVGMRILTFGTAGSLIRLRRDFIPEIAKSADDL